MFGFKNRKIRDLEQELRDARETATAAERRRGDARLDDARVVHARQYEQLADDVVKWQRKATDLEAGAKRVAARLQALRGGSLLMDLEEAYGLLEKRHGRLLAACVRYRGRLADQAALLRAQQRQLDAATGMDHPDIEAGAGWQARRPDRYVPLHAQSPSAPLPAREPGEVTS